MKSGQHFQIMLIFDAKAQNFNKKRGFLQFASLINRLFTMFL